MSRTFLFFLIFVYALGFSQNISFAKMDYDQISEAYLQSYRYEKTQNYTDAIKVLQIVYRNYSNSYTVNLRLGYLYLLNKNYANAMDHYAKAQKVLPNSIPPLLGMMSISIAKRNYSSAENSGFQILRKDYLSYYGNLKLAHALIMQKKLESAQQIVFKMLAIYPEDTAYLAQSAQIYSQKKEYLSAIAVYKNILILDPENVEAKFYLAQYATPKKKK